MELQFRLMHTFFRSHEDLMSVNVGAEVYAFFLDLAQICKGEYLETAGVCKDRLIPVHKLMQSAILLDQLVAGTHMKVVGIGKLYLGAEEL